MSDLSVRWVLARRSEAKPCSTSSLPLIRTMSRSRLFPGRLRSRRARLRFNGRFILRHPAVSVNQALRKVAYFRPESCRIFSGVGIWISKTRQIGNEAARALLRGRSFWRYNLTCHFGAPHRRLTTITFHFHLEAILLPRRSAFIYAPSRS